MGYGTNWRSSSLYIHHIWGEGDTPTSYEICTRGGDVVEGPFTTHEEAKARHTELRLKAATTTPKGKKRTREVYPPAEIPHLWAHKAVPNARNTSHNFYFNGDTIYSYGSHFPIARHITNDKGKPAILFTTKGYSTTTSGHKSAVRSAIPSGTTVFNVAHVEERWGTSSHESNLKDYQDRITDLSQKAARARINRDWKLNEAIALREEALKYAKFFKLKAKFPPITTDLDALRKRLASQAAAEAAETKRRNEEEQARLRIELAEQIEAFRNGGGASYRLRNLPVMLRVKDGEVETSMGARFPVSHAKRGLALVKAVVARGEEWRTNGHTCHLGHYRIDRIEKNGTVHAGCHVVSYDEIMRIAPDLDSTPDAQPLSEAA